MMPKKSSVTFSIEILELYQAAAIQNAKALVQEAEMLLSNCHHARAYFLSVAAIEETGKAALAFNGRGRNLKDSGIQSRLNGEFQDHGVKISAAFIAPLRNQSQADLRKSFQYIIKLQVALKYGREPSMYTDVGGDGVIFSPASRVSGTAATDCVRLARDCLAQTETMLRTDKPLAFSADQDQLFALGRKAKKVWEQSDFGEFLLHIVENEQLNPDTFAKAVCSYYDDYLLKDKKFKP